MKIFLLLPFFLLLSCSDSSTDSANTSVQSVESPKSTTSPVPVPKASGPADPLPPATPATPAAPSPGSTGEPSKLNPLAGLPSPRASSPAPTTPSISVAEQFTKHLSFVMQDNIEGLNACSEYSVLADGESIQLSWLIDENGRPQEIEVEENRLNNQPLANCVVNFLKTVRFEKKWKDFRSTMDFILSANEGVSA